MSSTQFSLTRSERKAVLKSADTSHVTIQIIPGIALAPRDPSAYSKRGWSNMVYCHSTRRVIVGSDWVRPQSN